MALNLTLNLALALALALALTLTLALTVTATAAAAGATGVVTADQMPPSDSFDHLRITGSSSSSSSSTGVALTPTAAAAAAAAWGNGGSFLGSRGGLQMQSGERSLLVRTSGVADSGKRTDSEKRKNTAQQQQFPNSTTLSGRSLTAASASLSGTGVDEFEAERPADEYDESRERESEETGLTLNQATSMEEHTAAVTRLRSPRRTSLLLSASADGTVRIWGPGETESRAVLDAASFMLPLASADNRPERRIILGSRGTSGENVSDAYSASVQGPGQGDNASIASVVNTNSPAAAGGRGIKVVNVWAEEACETIWAACSDCSLRVWSGAEGRALRFLKGHEDSITAMEGMGGIGGLQSRYDEHTFSFQNFQLLLLF